MSQREPLMRTLSILMLTAITLTGCGGALVNEAGDGASDTDAGQASVESGVRANELRPSGRLPLRTAVHHAPSHGAPPAGNGITYHGGPVMLGTTNIYYIWYGDWADDAATNILPDLASNIGGSPYFNINTTYFDATNTHVSNSVAFGGSLNNPTAPLYSHGTALTDANILTIVTEAHPTDPNAVYFVLTSRDVNETSGFCTAYCGWHDHATINGKDIKYSFVGNPNRCPSACTAGLGSPNGSVSADGMASIITHELEEAVTDPDLNAWWDSTGNENADKCAWTFGGTYLTGNGATANMTIGSRDFLIQRNWLNASGGVCVKSF
jgi:hypothetical protein